MNFFISDFSISKSFQNALCFLEGGPYDHKIQNDPQHLYCNAYLYALTHEECNTFLSKPKVGQDNYTLDFQSIEKFDQTPIHPNYNFAFFRWLKTGTAFIPIICHVIRSVFYAAMGLLHQKLYGKCAGDKLLFSAKCHLYLSWGHIITLWNTQLGLMHIHRGLLEKWKHTSTLNIPKPQRQQDVLPKSEELSLPDSEEEYIEDPSSIVSLNLTDSYNEEMFSKLQMQGLDEARNLYDDLPNAKRKVMPFTGDPDGYLKSIWIRDYDDLSLFELAMKFTVLFQNSTYCDNKLNFEYLLVKITTEFLGAYIDNPKFHHLKFIDLNIYSKYKIEFIFSYITVLICMIDNTYLRESLWGCLIVELSILKNKNPQAFATFCNEISEHFQSMEKLIIKIKEQKVLYKFQNKPSLQCFIKEDSNLINKRFRSLVLKPFAGDFPSHHSKITMALTVCHKKAQRLDIEIDSLILFPKFFLETKSQQTSLLTWMLCRKVSLHQKGIIIDKKLFLDIFLMSFFKQTFPNRLLSASKIGSVRNALLANNK